MVIMKQIFVMMLFVMMPIFIACDDDSSSSTEPTLDDSFGLFSNVVESSSADVIHSSENNEESSSSIFSSTNDDEKSSDSNRSSSGKEESSSTENISSSSIEQSSIAEFSASDSDESSSSRSYAGESIVDSRDGEIYKTVYIGNQHWMAENLRYRADETDTLSVGKYGRYYTWAVAMDTAKTPCDTALCKFNRVQRQGICPNGWHIPSVEEWKMFYNELEKISSSPYEIITDGNDWQDPGNNSTGFTAVPAGLYYNGSFDKKGFQTRIWSSSTWMGYKEYLPGTACSFRVSGEDVYIVGTVKYVGISVRCIENSEVSEKMDYLNHEEYKGPYGVLLDSRDGKKYKTIVLQNKEWMAENLNYETPKSVCGVSADSCAKYGRLYPFSEYRNVCPSGWRIPKSSEVLALLPFEGYGYIIGHEMKSSSGWIASDSLVDAYDGNGSNAIGLNLLPQGFYSDSMSYIYVHRASGFYIDRNNDESNAFLVWVETKEGRFKVLGEMYYVPVRCVKE